MIIAFYGSGKGKTTAAIGTALRSLNLGRSVLIVQLFKNSKNIKPNEIEFLKKLRLHNLRIKQFGSDKGWVNFRKPLKKDISLVKEAIKFIKLVIRSKRSIDLIILDELLLANYYKLLGDKDLIEIISSAKKNKIDLILTGSKMKRSILKYCDLVTEMKNIKHPFNSGQKAIEGLDF